MEFKGLILYPLGKVLFWLLVVIVILLTWIGARPVEEPYVITGQILTILYFRYFILIPQMFSFQNNFIKKSFKIEF
jgi:ubiquinol-cytochrome c reductase cytochrome b subunit